MFKRILSKYLLLWLVLVCALAFYWEQLFGADVFNPFFIKDKDLRGDVMSGMIAVTMLAVGSLLPYEEVKAVAKRWYTTLEGTAIQYISMPLLAYCVASALRLEGAAFAGVMLAGCVPGAMASNISSIWVLVGILDQVSGSGENGKDESADDQQGQCGVEALAVAAPHDAQVECVEWECGAVEEVPPRGEVGQGEQQHAQPRGHNQGGLVDLGLSGADFEGDGDPVVRVGLHIPDVVDVEYAHAEKTGSSCATFAAANIASESRYQVSTPDVEIRVSPDRSDLVEKKVIDGRPCLVIPITDEIHVNGIKVKI